MRVEWRATRLVACLLLAFVAAAGHAALVDWLYEVDVPVADQSAAERTRGAREALGLLITRLTGDKSPAKHDAVGKAMAVPERYFGGYEYRTDPKKEPPLALSVKFSPTATRELVDSAGLPMWSRSRPSVLAWLAMDADGERRVLGSGDGHPLAEALLERARQRGLVVALPAMDPEATPEVSTDVVWNRRWSELASASSRYGTQSLLVGRITLSSTGRWLADWTYRPVEGMASSYAAVEDGAGERRGSVDVTEPAIAAAAGVEMVVDALVDRYAVASRPLVDIAVQVENASAIASYGGLLDYLATLDYIEGVQVDHVRRDGVSLRLRTRVQRPQLHDLFAIDGRLVPVLDEALNPPSLSGDRLAWRPPSS